MEYYSIIRNDVVEQRLMKWGNDQDVLTKFKNSYNCNSKIPMLKKKEEEKKKKEESNFYT